VAVRCMPVALHYCHVGSGREKHCIEGGEGLLAITGTIQSLLPEGAFPFARLGEGGGEGAESGPGLLLYDCEARCWLDGCGRGEVRVAPRKPFYPPHGQIIS